MRRSDGGVSLKSTHRRGSPGSVPSGGWGRVLVVAVLVALAAAGGCRDGGDEGFVVLLDTEPDGLDPRFITSDASAKLAGLVHAGLVSTDTESGEPELELAESIRRPTPTRYDITLREGLTFHDGHPLTSEDVRYTFMQLDSDLVGSPYAQRARIIDSFEVEDDRHFSIELKRPNAPFRSELSMGIVPKHRCAGRELCRKPTVGAGPFEFVSKEGNRRYTLEAFDGYFAGAPKIERLTFRVLDDLNTRLLAVLGNSTDLVQNAVPPTMLPVVRDAEGVTIQTDPSFKYTYVGFNLEAPILEHRKVRRAIAYAIDRRSIIDHKFRGNAQLASGLLAPDHWAYEGDVKTYPYRPDRARTLLDEAGYENPEGDAPRFQIEFKVSANKFRKSIAQLMAHQLGRVGIDVRVRSYEWGTFFNDIKSGNFQMTMLMWPSVIEPSLYTWIFHSKNIPSADNRSAGANRGAYENERLDELLDKGERVVDRDERREIYAKVQKILARDVPYVSLWHEDNVAILDERVEDYFITPNARFEALKQARFPKD